MSTYMGIGTRYIGFSNRRPDGSHHATQWFVLLYLPVIPLRRDRMIVGQTQGVGAGVYSTEYSLLGQTRLNPVEILATYLTWWLLVPAIAAGPLLLLNAYAPESAEEFGPTLLALIWLVGAPMTIITIAKRVRHLP